MLIVDTHMFYKMPAYNLIYLLQYSNVSKLSTRAAYSQQGLHNLPMKVAYEVSFVDL